MKSMHVFQQFMCKLLGFFHSRVSQTTNHLWKLDPGLLLAKSVASSLRLGLLSWLELRFLCCHHVHLLYDPPEPFFFLNRPWGPASPPCSQWLRQWLLCLCMLISVPCPWTWLLCVLLGELNLSTAVCSFAKSAWRPRKPIACAIHNGIWTIVYKSHLEQMGTMWQKHTKTRCR